jgi:pimeloyl-ACP methyl ester carboxylesterase
MTPATVREWRDGGRWLPMASGNVFLRSGSGEGPIVLLPHGFPSSSYDFQSVIARLGQRSWLAVDFLGFGLSDKPHRHHYSLVEQADIVRQAVADAAAGLRELRPNAAVVELPGLGHYPQLEDPDAFTEAALRLLTE